MTIGTEPEPLDMRVSRLEALSRADRDSKTRSVFDPGFLLAAAAFIVSLTTTFYSTVRERAQEKDALTTQLRTTLTQFGEIGLKVIDASVRYKTEPQALADATSWANAQNVLLTSQAVHLADELGNGAESNDLMSIANRLRSIGKYKEAELILGRAIPLATSSIEKVDVDREWALLSYIQKRSSDGSRYLQDAVSTIEGSPGYQSDRYLMYELADIYYNWSNSEGADDCSSAKHHISLAADWAEKSNVNEQFKFRIQKGKDWLESHCPS